MNFYVNWHSAFRAIKNNPKRSILTIFGIIIGISSVITILSIGRGFEKDMIRNLTKNNSKKIEIQINFKPYESNIYSMNTNFFQDSDLTIVKGIQGVENVNYTKNEGNSISREIYVREKKKDQQIELIKENGKKVKYGRTLTSFDNAIMEKVALVDSTLASELFGYAADALNQSVEIDNQLFRIVGIYERIDQAEMFSISEINIQIPHNTHTYYFSEEKNKSSITITLNEGIKLDEVASDIIGHLTGKGSMSISGDYQIFDTGNLTKGIGSVLSTITYFITAIAGISLLIAGVGVMNMMYTSVSERTKEIGIRRALGATKNSIRIQFLLEGLTLTISGGLIGYFCGMLFAYALGAILNITVTIDIFTIILALGVSSAIGLLFSVVPASEAAKKDIIDILK